MSDDHKVVKDDGHDATAIEIDKTKVASVKVGADTLTHGDDSSTE